MENPALKAFVAHIQPELILAEVLIKRADGGYSLRQVNDRSNPALQTHSCEDARALAQYTAAGEFRPLKCAPTLKTGWQIFARSDAELETAISRLYPGAIADWYAAQTEKPPVTNYREYADRQSGMFRIAAKLDDGRVATVIRTTCAASLCLKRRWWTVAGLAPDSAETKSLVPCLEPCAVLMEHARKAARAFLDEAEKS